MKTYFKVILGCGFIVVQALALTSLSASMLAQALPEPPSGVASTVPPIVGPSSKSTVLTAAKPAPSPTSKTVAEDIRDIRGPKHLPSPRRWVLELVCGVVLAGLIFAGMRWRRRGAHPAALLPYQIALAHLAEARGLMHAETAREFSIVVSNIVRQFIEERFQVRAPRRTTEEFLRDFMQPSDALLASHRESLGEFLEHCDLAKFARWTFSTDELSVMLQSAEHFVRATGQPPETIGAQATNYQPVEAAF